MTKLHAHVVTFTVAIVLAAIDAPAFATSGGLNSEGCHNDRKYGSGYHCHRAPSRPAATVANSRNRPLGLASNIGGSYRSCAAARAAGAAPVRVGDPGYGRHLDRDGDGIGCE